MVRVSLGGRNDTGWVVAEVGHEGGEVGTVAALREITAVVSWGPPAGVVALTQWIATRWAGRWAVCLRTASPDRRVTGLPVGRSRSPGLRGGGEQAELVDVVERAWAAAQGAGVVTLRLPPAAKVVDVVGLLSAKVKAMPSPSGEPGIAVVAVPLLRQVDRLVSELGPAAAQLPEQWSRVRAGDCAVVVGSRTAVFAPVPDGRLGAMIVVGECDEALQETRAPTWHAREVAIERARREGVPCFLISAAPSVEAWRAGPVVALPERTERGGWPWVDVIDLREVDPAKGRFPDEVVRLLRGPERAVVIAQLTGRLRALVCRSCGEVARCEACASSVGLDAGALVCSRCATQRGAFCVACGSVALRPWRVGVSKLREELASVLGEPVAEAIAGKPIAEARRVTVGTEVLLNGAWRGVGRVVLLDFDHVLLAPTARAAERALGLVVRATRLVGGRAHRTGRVAVVTRVPDHPLVSAAVSGRVDGLAEAEWGSRSAFGLVPAQSAALISGPASAEFVAALRDALRDAGGDPSAQLVTRGDATTVALAPVPDALAALLHLAGRPAGRVRVEVDPYWL